MQNEFYNTGQEIIAGQDLHLMEERHEVFDPIGIDDEESHGFIAGKMNEFRNKRWPYALTMDSKNLFLWVVGAELGMPDDGGDE